MTKSARYTTCPNLKFGLGPSLYTPLKSITPKLRYSLEPPTNDGTACMSIKREFRLVKLFSGFEMEPKMPKLSFSCALKLTNVHS